MIDQPLLPGRILSARALRADRWRRRAAADRPGARVRADPPGTHPEHRATDAPRGGHAHDHRKPNSTRSPRRATTASRSCSRPSPTSTRRCRSTSSSPTQRYTYLLESVGRRALRPLLVHRPAGDDPHPRARDRDRGRATATASLERHEGDPLEFIARVHGALSRRAAARAAALLRRAGRLLRLRHVRYIETRLAGGAPDGPSGSTTPDILLLLTEELAVVDNLAGKLYLIVYADPAAPNAYARAQRAPAGTAQAAAHAGATSRTETARRDDGPAERVRREALQGGGASGPRSTSPPATSCRWCCRSACASRSPPRRCRSTARCARSTRRRTCSTSTSATSTSSAPRRRSWCAWRATRSPCARSPAPARAARRARRTRRSRPSCWPIRRSAPST